MSGRKLSYLISKIIGFSFTKPKVGRLASKIFVEYRPLFRLLSIVILTFPGA